MRFRALSPPRIQIRGKSHAPNVASERGRAAELRRTRARHDDQMQRLTPSTTRFTCRLPNASMNSAIFWNGWPTPSRGTSRQSARKSTATGGASATFTQSALSITCSRKCSSPGPRRGSGNKILELIDNYSRYDPTEVAQFYDQLFDLFVLSGTALHIRAAIEAAGGAAGN